MPETPEFDPGAAEIAEAILAPLRYASRDQWARLSRVRGLEATVTLGLDRLAQAAPLSVAAVDAIRRQVPSERDTPTDRQAAWSSVLRSLEALRKEPASPPATPQKSVENTRVPPQKNTHPPSTSSSGMPPLAFPRVSPAPLSDPAASASETLVSRARLETAVGLETSLSSLYGIGPKMAASLARRGLHVARDLLRFLPRRYQGQTVQTALSSLRPDTVTSVEGQINSVQSRLARGRRTLEVTVIDPTGSITLVWFRVPGKAFADRFVKGVRLRAAGMVKRYRAHLQISHPEVTLLEDSGLTLEMEDVIVPLYLEVEGIHPKQLRRLIARILPAARLLDDPLPESLRSHRALVSLGEAITCLHQPPQETPHEALCEMQTPWHQRLIYDELFILQLGLLRRREAGRDAIGAAFALPTPPDLSALLAEVLPFTPTGAQTRVVSEIMRDLTSSRPMQRLLQGDVGCGKTAVALSLAVWVARSGLQSALMAPTELLAEQHAQTAKRMLEPLGITTGLLTGHTPTPKRRLLLSQLASGELQLLIGTHALIQESIVFHRLGLAVIDEQHRFGVLQRERLAKLGEQMSGRSPHMLLMTATPIPRTLALTAYGDLEVSVIDELPPGRTPIATRLFRDQQRNDVYTEVRLAVASGRQAYVVFPLVEESDKEGMSDIRAATQSADELAGGPLYGLRLGLLHGRLSAEEKDQVMRAFLRRDMDVLIATTVIEVGIDVPNATVMVVEHAERFGLSQLHQLRGRVGRGAHQSSCLLLARRRTSEDAWRRLAIMTESHDGFVIAQEDLAIRGPGDFIGTRQSGLPLLTLADLSRDSEILEWAREDAQAIIADDPGLKSPKYAALVESLHAAWDRQLRLAQIG